MQELRLAGCSWIVSDRRFLRPLSGSLTYRPFALLFLIDSMNDLDQVLAVNVRGVMLCFQRAARQMVKQKRGGRLIGA